MDELKKQIELLRKMLDTQVAIDIHDEKIYELSVQLDELINIYNKMNMVQ